MDFSIYYEALFGISREIKARELAVNIYLNTLVFDSIADELVDNCVYLSLKKDKVYSVLWGLEWKK